MAKRHFLWITLLLCSLYAGAQQIDTVMIQSRMGHEVRNIVVLPEGYDQETTRYPVIYLLHGHGGGSHTWANVVKPDLDKVATQYGIIFVCPDGKNSWYWNSPRNADMQYEDYIYDEMPRYIDTHYRTIAHRTGRAITGFSMGGHGAMWNAIRHRDVFGAAGSMSGGLDIRPFPDSWNMKEQLGELATSLECWNNHTVINLIPTLNNGDLAIIIDCGVDDFFLDVNKQTHQSLLSRKIAHDFILRPGGHTREYWNNAIDYQVLFFHKYFTQSAK